MRIAVLANTTWYLYNFRLNLMQALRDAGHEVIALGTDDAYVAQVKEAGFRHVAVPMNGSGTNPLTETKTVLALNSVLRREKVDVLLAHTAKGNCYGGLAARLTGTPLIANISGLGDTFINERLLTRIVIGLYRVALARAHCVFFQNDDDLGLFLDRGLVRPEQVRRVPGSGVDTSRFAPEAASETPGGDFTFLCVARLLRTKGIGEYVAAARIVRERHPRARFLLLGPAGADNPAAIGPDEIARWSAEGIVEYLGETDDVLPAMRAADCVVLPSYYREGTPRVLLEAASLGKPVITTDTPGCRNTVEDGVTGLLCRVRDAEDLAGRMSAILALPGNERREMGRRGREKMMREFDERIVIERYLDAVNDIEISHNDVEAP